MRYIVKFIHGEGVFSVWDTVENERVDDSSAYDKNFVEELAKELNGREQGTV